MSTDPIQVEESQASILVKPPLRSGWLWLALVTVAYFSLFAFFPNVFFAVGVKHYPAWFLDTFALLASNDAVTRGLDPYGPNPLDYFHRPHVYSHWWLQLRNLGLTRADIGWVGFSLVAIFVLTALSRLRPKSRLELAWYALVVCSSPIVLAVDRANNDLLIFVLLAPVVPCLLSSRPVLRWMAPFLVAAAAGLKYYPAAAVIMLLAPTEPREWRLRLFLGIALIILVGYNVAGDLAGFGPVAPKPEGLMTFGAIGFFHELGWDGRTPRLLCALAGLLGGLLIWRRNPMTDWEPSSSQRSDWLHFILGAVLLEGCFFTSMNFAYRWVFAIWLTPFLWSLPNDPDCPASVRRLAWHARWLLLVVLWCGPVSSALLYQLIGAVPGSTIMRLASWAFLVEQPFDWAFFLCLLVFLAHFTRQALGQNRSA